MKEKLISQLFFAYTRVSTQKQGVEGVSLEAQERIIREYAKRNNLAISRWFQERETAAKRGRPIFLQMLSLLRKRKADGVIIHKIDRSARNLKDWADLGELIDIGVDIRFATENYDLRSRGGRLSADIQAVIASDYIRNLREEVKKGLYERIRQGRYPWLAPIGYLNKGKGLKAVDPVQGPLVRQAFELYATGSRSLEQLTAEMVKRGLKNTRGGPIAFNRFSKIFHNPFYTGVVRMPKTGELFTGVHEPIVSKKLFDRVEKLLKHNGRFFDHSWKHTFVFSRQVRCRGCGYNLIGERQKGHVYYRCHTAACAQRKTLREEVIESALVDRLKALRLGTREQQYLRSRFEEFCGESQKQSADQRKKIEMRLGEIRAQLARLVDGYAEGVFAKAQILDKQNSLVREERDLRDQLNNPEVDRADGVRQRVEKYLELANSASECYKKALPEEKRQMVRILTSNLEVENESVFIQLKFPFSELLEISTPTSGGHLLAEPRTWNVMFRKLYEHCVGDPAIAGEACYTRA